MAAMLRDDIADEAIDLCLVRHIDLMYGCRAALCLDIGGDALEVVEPARGQGDEGAFRGEEPGGDFTDSTGSTRNNDDFASHDFSPRS
jgi:hypothetical protein